MYINALKGISLLEWRKLAHLINRSFEKKEIEAAKDLRLKEDNRMNKREKLTFGISIVSLVVSIIALILRILITLNQ